MSVYFRRWVWWLRGNI